MSSSASYSVPAFNFSSTNLATTRIISPPVNHFKYRVSAAYTSTAIAERSTTTSVSSLYEVLGVPMGATCKEIKSAYRKLARVVHPDVAKEKKDSEFIKIHEAYSTLSDPGRRADYDRTLYGGGWASFGLSTAATNSRFSGGYSRRRWETDQCW